MLCYVLGGILAASSIPFELIHQNPIISKIISVIGLMLVVISIVFFVRFLMSRAARIKDGSESRISYRENIKGRFNYRKYWLYAVVLMMVSWFILFGGRSGRISGDLSELMVKVCFFVGISLFGLSIYLMFKASLKSLNKKI